MINTNNIQISKHNHPMKITVNVLSGETFIIPHLSGYDYDYRVDWGDGTWDRIYDYNDSGTTHNYISGGTYDIEIRGVCESFHFNNLGDKDKLIKVKSLGNVRLKNLNFYGTSNLLEFNNGGFYNLELLTSGRQMFTNCSSLTGITVDNWDVSNITNMIYMFSGCQNIPKLDVSNWDVSSANLLYGMFINCSSLTGITVDNWDVSNVTNMSSTFTLGCI